MSVPLVQGGVPGRSLAVFVLHFISQQITKLDVAQGKVDDRRIFLNKKVVFGEPLDVENNVPGNNPF